jgi:hypothetical protein
MIILGIDPGLNTGWAFLAVGELYVCSAGLGDPRNLRHVADHVVIEKPVIYPHAKENPNSLLTLAIQVGRYQEHFATRGIPVTLVEARTWKGQVPKSVTEKRVRAKFPNAGTFLDKYPKSLLHNVSDAIGLALWGAERLVL